MHKLSWRIGRGFLLCIMVSNYSRHHKAHAFLMYQSTIHVSLILRQCEALIMRADAVADVLETFGADRNDDLKKLIAHEIHQEELKNSAAAGHTNGGRLETHAENGLGLDVSTSERSENLDDLLAAAANKFA